MAINPIIRREWRERWRRGRAFWLLFGYTLMLAGMMYFLYRVFAPGPDQDDDYLQSTASFGRMTFVVLTGLQMVLWGLLTPALTAPAIAGERERGLLEGLQLSHLTPTQIVVGKLGASLLFCLLLLLAALPFSALCFLLGGISPVEFLAAIGFQLVGAATCASIGLWCSAWSRRANIALRSSFGLIVLWTLTSSYLFFGVRWPIGIPVFLPRPSPGISSLLCEFIGCSNPLIGLTDYYFPSMFGTTPGTSAFSWPTWQMSLIAQFTLCLLLFISSARATYRPLGETYWIESKKRSKKPRRRERAPAAEPPSGEPPSGEPTSNKAKAGWWEIPVVSLIPSGNPVLQREARGKFRMRQVPLIVLIVEGFLGAGVLYFYLRVLWTALWDASSRPAVWWGLSFLGLIVLIFSCAIMGATSLARERENGTWEALSLSLLSPDKIIVGKFGAILFACGVFFVPFLPLLLPCIHWVGKPATVDAITPLRAIGTITILIGTAASFSAWGMLWSWIGRRTASAVSWTLATLFLIEAVLPLLLTILEARIEVSLLRLEHWNPFVALGNLTNSTNPISSQLNLIVSFAVTMTLIVSGLLLGLCFLIRREMRN